MSPASLLDALLLQPMLAIYGALFAFIERGILDVGASLIVFSVALNVLMLPVYAQIERFGRDNAWHRAAMNEEIARISANFTGRERYFYVRTIHRQFGYRPIYALFAPLDLYVMVFVFVTVYAFLSNVEQLKGASFWFIADLQKPDGLLFGQNLLPIAMTLINVASAIFYTSDKGKRRSSFGLSALFLVLLYQSPAGLVLFWTTNNVFSLTKNVVKSTAARRDLFATGLFGRAGTLVAQVLRRD